MAYGDVPPNFDGLPPEAVPWGRWITNEVQQQGKQRNRDSQRISNAINTGQGALSVTEAQGQEIVVAQDTASNAGTEAEAAKTVAFRSPGDNLFDNSAISGQDITRWDTQNFSTYSWVSQGIQFDVPSGATSSNGLAPVAWNRELLELSGSGTSQTLSIEFNAILPDSNAVTYLLTDFRTAEGTVAPGGSSGQGPVGPINGAYGSFDLPVPPTAKTLRLGFSSFRNTAGDPFSSTISNIRVRFQIGSNALQSDLTGKRIGGGSSVSGPLYFPPGSRAAFVNSSGVETSSLTHGVPFDLSTEVSGNLPTSRLTDDSRRLNYAGIFDVLNLFGETGTFVQSVPNTTWTALGIPNPSTNPSVIIENTINDGAAATISGTGTNRRLIAPVAGKYLMTATVGFSASNVGTARSVAFQVGTSATGNRKGQSVFRIPSMPNFNLWVNSMAIINASAGDILSVMARHDSGANRDLAIESLQVVYLGPA